mgnify:CR=1 FL=1
MANASSIIVLAKRESDKASDGRTFDILHRLKELGVKGRILAECVDDANRDRLIKAGADVVIRPIRAYPEMILRAFVAPGAEEIIENNLKQNEHLTPLKGGFGYFIDQRCYYSLAKSMNSGFTYHYLQIYLKTNVDEYYQLTTKVYGDEFVEERLCESLSLFERITFLE